MFAVVMIRGSRDDPRDHASSDDLIAALTPFHKADASGAWANDKALLAQALIWNTPESKHEATPEICPDTGRVIASWIRLDNRDALCGALKLAPTLTDPQIVLAVHRAWGAECADRLEGDFSFVIYDPAQHSAFCARDSLGAKPFYHVLDDEVFIAATSVAALRAIPRLSLSPDQKWTALFLANLCWTDTQAAYESVRKLPPAHHLTIGATDTSGPTEYFRFDLNAPQATRRG